MLHRIVWLQSALDEPADAWMRADSTQRRTITAAARAAEEVLKDDPQHQGESRPGGKRVIVHLPLGLAFEVNRIRSEVRVLHVWIIRRRKQRPM